VNFDANYKISGVVIEAERVELLPTGDSSRKGAGNGIVIPVSAFLPSTEQLLMSHVNAYDAREKLKKKTSAAKRPDE
jgi:hypothetical protein